jgi:FkbM family methyltransferase
MLPYTSVDFNNENSKAILEKVLSFKEVLQPRKVDKPVVLFGAGNLGKLAADLLAHVGVPVTAVVNDNPLEGEAQLFWQERGIKVFLPHEVPVEMKDNCLMLNSIVTAPVVPVLVRLRAQGWKDVAPFYDASQSFAVQGKHPLNNGWFARHFTEVEKDVVRAIFHWWGDDASRAHYLQFLAWRMGRVELFQEHWPVRLDNRFFIPEVAVKLGENEAFLDCGAHVGSVIKAFLWVTSGKYDSIHAFEPDGVNYQKLLETVSSLKRVTTSHLALASEDGSQSFATGFDYASKLTQHGNTRVSTTKLDWLGIKPTFVKLHTEGSELSIIKGGINIFRCYRPILALTVYHNDEGIWETPLYLMEKLSDYRFMFRSHSWAGTGAVIYCIPTER